MLLPAQLVHDQSHDYTLVDLRNQDWSTGYSRHVLIDKGKSPGFFRLDSGLTEHGKRLL